jgi:hypothetical protein
MRIATLLLLVATGGSASSLTLHMKTNGKDSVTYLDGNRIRVESEGGAAMIFDGDAKKLIRLDDAKKTFTVTTPAEMAEAGGKAKEQLNAAMAKMPPEQRKNIEEQMAKSTGANVPETTWERTGKDETIAGLACKGYKGTTVGGPSEACFVPWGHGLTKADFTPMLSLSSMMSSALAGTVSASRAMRDFERSPGFPASQVVFDESGKRIIETRLESVSRGSIPASRFAVPAGYSEGEKLFQKGH